MRHQMRWLIVVATFLLSVLLYVDRVCISAAKEEISSDLELTETQMGWVFSAFAIGYALLQTPSGWVADRTGPRRALALIVTAWSVFTGLTAAAGSWASMMVVRFLFGAGEAGAFPGMARAVYSWIPMQERGLVQGINFSGSRIGAAVTLPLIAWLITEIGWRPTFVVLMFVGFVWAAAWLLAFRDDPAQVTWLSDVEREYLLANRQRPASSRPLGGAETAKVADHPTTDGDPEGEDTRATDDGSGVEPQPGGLSFWRALRSSGTVGALCAQYFASNFVFFFGLTWFFPQLQSRYGLSGMEASLFAAAPMVCGAAGNWVSGWWIDRLYSPDRWALSRRLPAMTGFALAAVGIFGSAYATTPLGSSVWFSLCIFGADMTLSPSWSSCVDIGRQNSGVVSGTMNMAGNVGSFVTSLAFPYLLGWTGSPLPFFFIAAAMNVAAIGLWFRIDPTVPLETSP